MRAYTKGLVIGMISLSIGLSMASVPQGKFAGKLDGKLTDDTTLYGKDGLQELDMAKEKTPNFDSDVSNLAAKERRYQEKLPSLSENQFLKRSLEQKKKKPYSYTGSRSKPNG